MHKKIYAAFVALTIGILISCTNNNEQDSDFKTLTVDMQDAQPLKDAVASISVVNFSDTTDTFFGEILSMEIINDTIYIFDRFSNQGLYAYDKSGQLLYAYNKKGPGPEEFIGLADFSINGQEIALLDCHANKIIFIDKQGNFIRQTPAEYQAQNLCVTDNGIWYDRSNIASENNEKLIYVPNGGEKTMVLPIPDDIENINFLTPHATVKARGDSIYYLPCIEPSIYKCHDAKAQMLYALDFNGSWPTWGNSKSQHPGEILKNIVDNGLVHQLRILAENDLICLTFHCNDKVYVDIIDTKTDNSALYYLTTDDLDKTGEPVCISNGQIVFGNQDSLLFMTLK